MGDEWVVRPREVGDLDESDFEAYAALLTTQRRAADPEAPALDPDEVAGQIRFEAPEWYRPLLVDAGAEGAGCVGLVFGYVQTNGEHPQLHEPNIFVDPAWRRRRIGTALIAACCEKLEDAEGLIVASSHSPEGHAFGAGLGARDVLHFGHYKLDLATVDQDHLNRLATQPSDEFEIIEWQTRCPDDLVASYLELSRVMESAPLGETVPEPTTAEEHYELAASLIAGDISWWTLMARHRPTRALVAYTDMFVPASGPAQVPHTGTRPAFRRRGLARWLKAVMTRRLIERRPDIRTVRTTNALENDGIRRTNQALGYVELATGTCWHGRPGELRL